MNRKNNDTIESMILTKPIIVYKDLDSLIKTSFRKYSYGPFSVIYDILRFSGIYCNYWVNDIRRLGFGIPSNSDIIIDSRRIDDLPDIFKSWVKSNIRDNRLTELGI